MMEAENKYTLYTVRFESAEHSAAQWPALSKPI